MEVILHPTISSNNQNLKELYKKAISEAEELFILSAYLTDWGINVPFPKNCQKLKFIVGTDFGITRKDACRKVLKWLPAIFKDDFRAADKVSGFHPKIMMWRNSKSNYFIIIGSSNLTQAAFSTNYEVNIVSQISEQEFQRIKSWVDQIYAKTKIISESWLKYKYKEAPKRGFGRKKEEEADISIKLPKLGNIAKHLKDRRSQQKKFKDIQESLLELMRRCASGEMKNQQFYKQMYELWGWHESRFQGQGFQIRGKQGNWKEICVSLLKILDYSKTKPLTMDLDNMVKNEIDKLALSKNPNRLGWMSEMLCHFLPDIYPLYNRPVKNWLKHIKYRPPRGASDGVKYIDLTGKLRSALIENKSYPAKNLAELDGVIWYWNKLREKAKRQQQYNG